MNPVWYLFDFAAMVSAEFRVAHHIPYSDIANMSPEELAWFTDRDEPLGFGHTHEDLIGEQTQTGFLISDFYEDIIPGSVLASRIATLIATRAVKPSPQGDVLRGP